MDETKKTGTNTDYQKDQGSNKDSNRGNKTANGRKGNETRGKQHTRGRQTSDIPSKNDWRWYALSEQIAKDIGSIPYNNIPGVPTDLDYMYAGTPAKLVQPSCMALEYINTPGKATSRTDGINMAATQLYTFVRHVNSGAINYEAADLMMYVLAMRDIYAHYFECKRALGFARYFTVNNRNFPDTISAALHIDLRDAAANIAAYRGRLNAISHKINSFAVPKYFKAFERSAYIASNVFSDSNSLRGQFYILRRGRYYKWSTTTSQTGTELVAVPIALDTLGGYMNYLEEMLDALFLDTDANTMSGDILKAFSDAELYGVAETDETYTLAPVYDEDILSQIENCVYAMGWERFPDSQETILNVRQKDQLITFDPTFIGSSSSNFEFLEPLNNYMFNSHKDDPTYQDTLEWSRLMTIVDSWTEEQQQYSVKFSFGLEFVIRPYIYCSGEETPITFQQHDTGSTLNDITSLAKLSQFDWHPLLYLHLKNLPDNLKKIDVFGDLMKYTIINRLIISRIHDNACQSCFYAEDLYSKARRNQNSSKGSTR